MEPACDLWPEFAQHIETHIRGDAEARSLGRGPEAALVARMVEVADGLGTGCAHPFRIIEHQVAGIAVGHKHVADSME